jgi:Type IV secretion system pilin
MRNYITHLFCFVLLSLPTLAGAQGVVPCNPKVVDGVLVDTCGFCQVGQLIKNGSEWVVKICGILVVILIIYAGLRMVLAVGATSAKTDARRFITKVLIGYAILLGAWVLVDTFIKFLIPGSSYGVANPLMCG